MKKVIFSIASFFFFSALCVYADSEGEKLFKTNNPGEAVAALEEEIRNGTTSPDTYNFLGLSYFQLGDYAKSMDAFEKGIKSGSGNRKLLAFNEGNVAYAAEDYARAESCYSLALAAAPDFYNALLNRANSRLMARKYPECLVDYKRFVAEQPDDPQTPEIIRLIAYLEEEIKRQEEEAVRLAEEQRRLEEENRRVQEELARQKAEREAAEAARKAAEEAAEAARKAAEEAAEAARKAAEEERRRKLLEDVANSLQQTETTNMTAGAEDVLDYEYESELE